MENEDAYVRGVINHLCKEHDLEFDVDQPTKNDLVEFAKDADTFGADRWKCMEIAVGRKINSNEDKFSAVMSTYEMGRFDKDTFYNELNE